MQEHEENESSAAVRPQSGLFTHAPWWIIAFSVTFTVLSITAVIRFSQEQEKKRALKMEAAVTVKDNILDAPPEEEIKIEPIPINEPDENAEPIENAEPEIFIPEAMISDHNESDDDQDFEMFKGDSQEFDSSQNQFDSIGLGAGSGVGAGRYGSPYGGRRKLMARKGRQGATQKTQEAVLSGLRWLARHQSPDGSWRPAEFSEMCHDTKCVGPGDEAYSVGVTGLAVLAYLGAGFTPFSRDSWIDEVNKNRYVMGKVIQDGIRWLLDQQNEDGAIGQIKGEFFYNHAIATMAFSEAYGLTSNGMLKNPAQKAVDFLIRYQTPSPDNTGFLGWRYRPDTPESDTSATGWCVMALKSAELSRLKVSRQSMTSALAFVQSMTKARNGLVAYMNIDQAGLQPTIPGINEDFVNHKPSMTAVGMLIRTFVEHNLEDPYLEKGAELVIQDLPRYDGPGKNNDYYYWYYGSLALNQYDGPDSPRNDGKYWKEWNQALISALVPNQRKDGCYVGSWDNDDRWSYAGGRIYTTAINTLTLEVYYRYPNAFGVGKRAIKEGSTQ